MTSIEAVATYLPARAMPIDSCLGELGIERSQVEFYRRVFGNAEVRRDPAVPVADMMLAAAGDLAGLTERAGNIRYLVQARTIQMSGHPHGPLRTVRDKLGLRSAATFSVSQQACASGLLAIDVCGRLLAADDDPDALALVFAGEKTFSRVTSVLGAAVMGEGVAAVLVGHRGDGDPLLGYATRTHGEFNDPMGTPPELQPRFNDLYPRTMTEVITTALSRAGLSPADVSLVLPHNVNRTGWQRVARALGLPEDRIFLDNLPVLGHCFCADSFINYRTACDRGLLRPGDHYVMTSIGAGATWAAMVFQYRGASTPRQVCTDRPSAIRPAGPAGGDHR